jgi:NitT/TauT family transport system ATP-binding protein
MLMDEPFGGLDMVTREQMNMELLRICEETGKTVFFITHSVTEAIFLGERIIVMTGRPGTVKATFGISLQSRERDVLYTHQFGQYVKKVEAEMQRG